MKNVERTDTWLTFKIVLFALNSPIKLILVLYTKYWKKKINLYWILINAQLYRMWFKKNLNLFTCILDPSTEHYICILKKTLIKEM